MLQLVWLRPESKVDQMDVRLDSTVVFAGVIARSAEALFSSHVISGSILFPGVGYVEMAFAASPNSYTALSTVAFVRPCLLPNPHHETRQLLSLLYTQHSTGSFEVSSRR